MTNEELLDKASVLINYGTGLIKREVAHIALDTPEGHDEINRLMLIVEIGLNCLLEREFRNDSVIPRLSIERNVKTNEFRFDLVLTRMNPHKVIESLVKFVGGQS